MADFVNAVVGERLGDVQLEAAEVLQKLFAEQVETTGGDEVRKCCGNGTERRRKMMIR